MGFMGISDCGNVDALWWFLDLENNGERLFFSFAMPETLVFTVSMLNMAENSAGSITIAELTARRSIFRKKNPD